MIEWNIEHRPVDIVVTGVVDGERVVRVVASHIFTTPDEPNKLMVRSLWVREDLRGDDSFATEVYLGLLAKAIELGYLTEDEMLDYEWDEFGVRVGGLRILIPQNHDGRDETLRYRLISRGKVEEIAAEKKKPITGELLPDEEQMVELKEMLDAERKAIDLDGAGVEEISRDPGRR